ncbi:MAG: hypothetical protein CL910_17085 [Deltaproteobacteria bacterium]|jgi:uncharacterized protein (DUF427 family)|nr:hypothetical protein [Deltaproteobacteria bacterium]
MSQAGGGRRDLAAQRRYWRQVPRRRPPDIEPTGPGEESVWEYPRPPRLEASTRRVRVEFAGRIIAESHRALRVLETAGAPVFYLPPLDVDLAILETGRRESLCEWKGLARYHDVQVGGRRAVDAAWSYPQPDPSFERLRDHLAFYPGRVDACYLDDERVRPQPGSFYGGWVSSEIKGPFKGIPGSEDW